MYLKEMGSVPLLTREEEVEISKRIEKAQIQIEKIILSVFATLPKSNLNCRLPINGKDRFDKIISEKEVEDKAKFLKLLPKLAELLRAEDQVLEKHLLSLKADNRSKAQEAEINEEIEKCRIRTQAYLHRAYCRHNIIEDFGEVVFKGYDRFLDLEKEINELKVQEQNVINLLPPSSLPLSVNSAGEKLQPAGR